ncbi:MAG: hypothetical protein JSV64_04685 [Candidatus Bathyarchaeota archaeon]|jgi:uncharacterized ferredoxin-like protein|nr:MAG: hypothetical protein JSV64_04685 [Candidatus Bathyarchaeota archaeon]
MPVIRESGEREAMLDIAKLMMVSARTAPKSGGIDDIVLALVHGEEKEHIALEMERIAKERNSAGFVRDSGNVHNSDAILLVGLKGPKTFGLNCGACGYGTCEQFQQVGRKEGSDFVGPTCIFKSLDMGIALGSAAKTAGLLNADSRIMYRIGTAAKKLQFIPEAHVIMGIPISARGKSIYFDRPQTK